MKNADQPLVILMADDDPQDRQLTQKAFVRCRLANELRFVENGEQLLEYLRREGEFSAPGAAPWPGIILLDLNMPRKDGREALAEIKADPAFCQIPVVVMTTSKADEDIARSYSCGANSFITKPITFAGLVEVIRDLGRYWFEIVELPPPPQNL
ncbi:MAG: response regulator [Candidatus Wallbacteria bacterium]|nr:response regulator [Candidatus Wallbacteria bacterium]